MALSYCPRCGLLHDEPHEPDCPIVTTTAWSGVSPGDWYCRECGRIVLADQVELSRVPANQAEAERRRHTSCGGRVEPHPTMAFGVTEPDPLEAAAEAGYARYMEGLVGCCEPVWSALPPSHRHRLVQAHRAAILAYLLERADKADREGVVIRSYEVGLGSVIRDIAAELRQPAETAGEQEGS